MFILTAPPHFHCGHRVHDYRASTVKRVSHGTGLLFYFWDQGERFTLTTGSRNTRRTAAEVQQHSPLPHCCSLPSALWDELMGKGERGCRWLGGIRTAQLQFGTAQFVSGHLNAFQRVGFGSPRLGNLCYLEWDYPSCKPYLYLSKTSVQTPQWPNRWAPMDCLVVSE